MGFTYTEAAIMNQRHYTPKQLRAAAHSGAVMISFDRIDEKIKVALAAAGKPRGV
jgi:hypothetical protein